MLLRARYVNGYDGEPTRLPQQGDTLTILLCLKHMVRFLTLTSCTLLWPTRCSVPPHYRDLKPRQPCSRVRIEARGKHTQADSMAYTLTARSRLGWCYRFGARGNRPILSDCTSLQFSCLR